jgi:LmbE family N-acetylglucosaminyl deacetylase
MASRVTRQIARVIMAGALLSACLARPAAAQFPPAPGTGPGLAETIEAIDNARVTTRILYVTAHPDDESAAVLTYLARGLHAEVALLSLTRGEGGQNALGPEQAPQLGLIRTQELLAATRGYGVKLFFTRARDFGYSKTPEETMKVWGDQVLDDMVRVIRTFRPHIVINDWAGVRGGHGQHQASGLLTPKAVQMAADAKAFPEQLQEGLHPWSDKEPVQILGLERRSDNPKGYVLPLDEVSPLWGKTWREIGLDAFVNHRTQGIAGFLGSPFARRPVALSRQDGGNVDLALLTSSLGKLGDFNPIYAEPLRIADQSLARAREAALRLDWIAASRALVSAGKQIEKQRSLVADVSDPAEYRLWEELLAVENRFHRALAMVAGVEATAQAGRSDLVVGESFAVSAGARCRNDAGCTLGELRLALPQGMKETKHEGDAAKGFQISVSVENAAPPRSTWDRLQPEPEPMITARQTASIAGYAFTVSVPVLHIQASSTRVDKVPLRIVPALTLAVEPKQAIEVLGKARKPFDLDVRVHSYATQASKASVGLDVPAGWSAGAPQELVFAGQGDQYVRFRVTPPQKLAAGSYTISAYAKRGEEKFTASLEPLPSLPTQLWSEPAESNVRAFEVSVPENLRVGYITAEGEPIPEALGRLGIHVEMLDAAALAFGDLSRFDAIVVGVRAYELRPDLAPANARLLHYAGQGGTLVVQYNRDNVWDRLLPAPYPSKIGNPTPRITDENSPVRFLNPDDPLLNAPNKITQEDFRGWVQERGLYYWSQFDVKYTPVLAMNDPGEAELTGGLVYTRYGAGTYIYTGLAFFRQLPEGVPGAYRLFVNLLSASRLPKAEH